MMQTIQYFHNDLKKYSSKDILLMAKNEKLSGNIDNLRWMLAIKHSITKGEMPNIPFPALESMIANWKLTDFLNYAHSSKDTLENIKNLSPLYINDLIKQMELDDNNLIDAVLLESPVLNIHRDTIVRAILEKFADYYAEYNEYYEYPRIAYDIANIRGFTNILNNFKEIDDNFDPTIEDSLQYGIFGYDLYPRATQYLLQHKLIPEELMNEVLPTGSLGIFIVILFYGYNLITMDNLIKFLKRLEEDKTEDENLILKVMLCHLYKEGYSAEELSNLRVYLNEKYIRNSKNYDPTYTMIKFIKHTCSKEFPGKIQDGIVKHPKYIYGDHIIGGPAFDEDGHVDFESLTDVLYLIPKRFHQEFLNNNWYENILTYDYLIADELYRPGAPGALEAERHFTDLAEEVYYRPGNEGALNAEIDFEERIVDQEYDK